MRAKQRQEETTCRLYYAECLRTISENCARICGGNYITLTLADVLKPGPVENRSAGEIAEEVIKKCGLEVHRQSDESV